MKVSNCRSYGAIVLVAGQSLADVISIEFFKKFVVHLRAFVLIE